MKEVGRDEMLLMNIVRQVIKTSNAKPYSAKEICERREKTLLL